MWGINIPVRVLSRLSLKVELDEITGILPGYTKNRWVQPEHVLFAGRLIFLAITVGITWQLDRSWSSSLVSPNVYMGFVLTGGVLLFTWEENGGVFGFSRLVTKLFFAGKVKETPATRIRITPVKLELGSRTFLWDELAFVRLAGAHGGKLSYLTLQVFTKDGNEFRWRVGRRVRKQVNWLLDRVRQSIERSRMGSVPVELQQLRSNPIKENR